MSDRSINIGDYDVDAFADMIAAGGSSRGGSTSGSSQSRAVSNRSGFGSAFGGSGRQSTNYSPRSMTTARPVSRGRASTSKLSSSRSKGASSRSKRSGSRKGSSRSGSRKGSTRSSPRDTFGLLARPASYKSRSTYSPRATSHPASYWNYTPKELKELEELELRKNAMRQAARPASYRSTYSSPRELVEPTELETLERRERVRQKAVELLRIRRAEEANEASILLAERRAMAALAQGRAQIAAKDRASAVLKGKSRISPRPRSVSPSKVTKRSKAEATIESDLPRTKTACKALLKETLVALSRSNHIDVFKDNGKLKTKDDLCADLLRVSSGIVRSYPQTVELVPVSSSLPRTKTECREIKKDALVQLAEAHGVPTLKPSPFTLGKQISRNKIEICTDLLVLKTGRSAPPTRVVSAAAGSTSRRRAPSPRKAPAPAYIPSYIPETTFGGGRSSARSRSNAARAQSVR